MYSNALLRRIVSTVFVRLTEIPMRSKRIGWLETVRIIRIPTLPVWNNSALLYALMLSTHCGTYITILWQSKDLLGTIHKDQTCWHVSDNTACSWGRKETHLFRHTTFADALRLKESERSRERDSVHAANGSPKRSSLCASVDTAPQAWWLLTWGEGIPGEPAESDEAGVPELECFSPSLVFWPPLHGKWFSQMFVLQATVCRRYCCLTRGLAID